jgi:hypothetical protein
VVPVTMAAGADQVKVVIRNVPELSNELRFAAYHPGSAKALPVSVLGKGDGSLELTVPIQRGCAMVKIEASRSRGPAPI